jgi:hypothetical protein
MLLLSIASCDLLQPPVDDDTPTRPRRDGGEGEGEGEGEGPNVPPDVPPHPQGPRVQSFSASQTTLNDNQTATLTAVVSDPDGAADIIGALLIEPVSGSTLGTLSTAGAPGTFTASISWSDYGAVAPIEFVRGSAQRFIRVQFSDGQGHQTTSTLALTMACGDDLPACNNSCGEVRCAGQDNQCLSTQGNAISNDDLCSVCNTGCQACGADCACFDPSSRCSGGSDCVALVDADSNVTATECRVTGGPAVRNDGFVTWSVGGRAVPVAFGQRFSLPVDDNDIFDLLCAPFGGYLPGNVRTEALPTDLANGEIVLTLEDGCSAASLQTLAQCEPVIGLSTAVVNGQGQRITCVDPIGSTPGTGAFQETCASGGACTGDMACDGDNVCQESCFDATDCDSCVAANPAGCSCDPTGACQVGGGGGGDFACASTRTITGTSANQSGSNAGLTNAFAACSGDGPDQAWKFTPSTTGTYVIQTGGSLDTVMHVRADCAAPTFEFCDDDGAATGSNSLLTLSLTANVPVLIVVDSFNGSGGSYTLSITRQ